jgi:hypothetical protein
MSSAKVVVIAQKALHVYAKEMHQGNITPELQGQTSWR